MQARLVAMQLISSVIDKKISLDGLTDAQTGQPSYLALEMRDRALVRAMVLATLRHYGTIETNLAHFINRPLPRKARALHHLLFLTAAQILHLDVPDHASIHIAVTIAKSRPDLCRFAPLVNALARQLTRRRDEILVSPNPVSNVPPWFAQMLKQAYGLQKADAILAAQAHEPLLDIHVKNKTHLWAKKLSGRVLPGGTHLRLDRIENNLTQAPGFDSGDWWVQDIAASFPARLLGVIEGKKVADLCAAPGGKTAQLALLNGEVTAFDSSKSRMQRLIENMQRLKLNVKTHIGDVRHFQPLQLFDAVLCDAPCSSTGTIRRHPDILWTKSPETIDRLAQLQLELLESALRFAKQGGVVVFSNCSLAPQEGEELMARFLQSYRQARLSPIRPEELHKDFATLITQEGFLRSTPADWVEFGGMDGFFAARLVKL